MKSTRGYHSKNIQRPVKAYFGVLRDLIQKRRQRRRAREQRRISNRYWNDQLYSLEHELVRVQGERDWYMWCLDNGGKRYY